MSSPDSQASRRCGAVSEERIKVVVGDAPRWTGARDLAQVDPRFGPQADRGVAGGRSPPHGERRRGEPMAPFEPGGGAGCGRGSLASGARCAFPGGEFGA